MTEKSKMRIPAYLKELDRQYRTGNATEHTHRPALKALLEAAAPGVLATNEPKQIACGAPDFVLTRDSIPLGYIEAKDLGRDLDHPAHKAQLRRYTGSLDNLIFTNYTEFRLFREGKQVMTARIAEAAAGRVKARPGNFNAFEELYRDFTDYQGRTITSAAGLAGHMAVKARMLAGVIESALSAEGDGTAVIQESNNTLQSQLAAFRKYLIYGIKLTDFADIYAQTVAYGMFAARLHDPASATFSRKEAADLIPANNPFLRKFFQHIAGYDLDERIRWIVDDLADIFRAADVGELMRDYGKATQQNDPFIHFYETFLGAYKPKLRKSRGVYYTPEPVVNFIVRAVDSILQSEFDLPQGLADTSKTTIAIEPPPSADKRKAKKIKKQVHKVQILDPAAGTGTFLAAIVQHIYHERFANQKGLWPDYVREHLIPRLNGFEVLMASYAMAHTKLEMVLRETGCELQERLRVFLTNSLEEHHPDTGSLFAEWLSTEANEANTIKRDTPVMVVIGNPPYKSISSNMGEWINNLIEDYKYIDGEHFGEKKHWLHDDYVKFIRYGQHYIDRTDKGVLAYINNHSFLDNPTFRGMRWSLLQSFDAIYIIDLHGNSKKKETAPDGSADKNVFDIQQGVAINLFVKTGKKNVPTRVFHHDLYGLREGKYQLLWENNLSSVDFAELNPRAPYYFFVPKSTVGEEKYKSGFSVNDLFSAKATGMITARDKFVIDFDRKQLLRRIFDFIDLSQSDEEIRLKYFGTSSGRKYLPGDSRGWKMTEARRKITNYPHEDLIKRVAYRPFDNRYIYYHSDMVDWGREKIMWHFLAGENVGLVTAKSNKSTTCDHFYISQYMMETKCGERTTQSAIFPLYLYPDTNQQTLGDEKVRKPNLNPGIVQTIAASLGLRFTDEKKEDDNTFAPIDLLDYLYAVLHSPAYRQRYQELLKIGFPRVPYPTDKDQFRQLAQLGGELRTLHLLESPALNTPITGYPTAGDNVVTKPEYQLTDPENRLGKVSINKTQHFTGVPESAWHFHIGGYQPAQKWLKDRKGRVLHHDDIIHYQKIIVALTETGRIMREIDQCTAPPPYEELDIVRITTNAYHKEGLQEAEEGTIVLVHKGKEENAYEVEFENWTKRFPIKVKTLTGNEIEMVKKWHK